MRLQILIILLLWAIVGKGQETFGGTTVSQTHFFGINLIPNINGDIYHFAEVEVVAPNKYRYNWLTRQEFIMKASGMAPSKANPGDVDLFRKNGIKTDNPFWDPIDNLWRLRFQGHPHYPADNSGWYIPNPKYTIPDSVLYKNGQLINDFMKQRRDSLLKAFEKQRQLLAEFGIHKFSDFALGEKVFKMIKAVQDVGWIESYINKPAPGPVKQLIKGQKPVYQSKTLEERRKETQVHDPYQDVTIYKVQRSGLDQLLHGVKKKKKGTN